MSNYFAREQVFIKGSDGILRPVSEENPMPFKEVSGGGGSSEPVSILGAGTAAGNSSYPKDGVTTKETDITVFYGGSTAATTGTFTTFLVDINDRESILPGIRNNISIAQVTSANVGDVVDYTVPTGCKLRIKYSAPSGGGTLSIKGVV